MTVDVINFCYGDSKNKWDYSEWIKPPLLVGRVKLSQNQFIKVFSRKYIVCLVRKVMPVFQKTILFANTSEAVTDRNFRVRIILISIEPNWKIYTFLSLLEKRNDATIFLMPSDLVGCDKSATFFPIIIYNFAIWF